MSERCSIHGYHGCGQCPACIDSELAQLRAEVETLLRERAELVEAVTQLRAALAKAENDRADLMAALALIDIGPSTAMMSDDEWLECVHSIADCALAKARGEK